MSSNTGTNAAERATGRYVQTTKTASDDRFAVAADRYADGEADLAVAAAEAGVSRWEFVERLREDGIAEPAGAGERP